MTKKQLNSICAALAAAITLGGCFSGTKAKEPLGVDLNSSCGGCEGRCPFTSSYNSLFEPSIEGSVPQDHYLSRNASSAKCS